MDVVRDTAVESVTETGAFSFEKLSQAAAEEAAIAKQAASEAFQTAERTASAFVRDVANLSGTISAIVARESGEIAAVAKVGGVALKVAGPAVGGVFSFVEAMTEGQGTARSAVIGVSSATFSGLGGLAGLIGGVGIGSVPLGIGGAVTGGLFGEKVNYGDSAFNDIGPQRDHHSHGPPRSRRVDRNRGPGTRTDASDPDN
jgi:hypothetical protein